MIAVFVQKYLIMFF